MEKLSINIPFSGFYESFYSEAIDSELESLAENYAEEDKNSLAKELRLTAGEFGEVISVNLNYEVACQNVAKTYVDVFSRQWGETIGVELGLEFEEMTSPKEYNFATDRIFCLISARAVRKLFAKSRKDNHVMLATIIRKRHTSYDGFISFYTNELESWLAKPVIKWDANELATLLIAVHKLSPDYDSEWKMGVYYGVTDDGLMGEVDPAIDWNKLAADIGELHADKEAELHELDPSYIAPAKRCSDTLDLFREGR